MKMPIDNGEIIELLCTLAEEERLRVTFSESVKGGLIAGGMAAAGGVIFGPIGLAVGGTLGGCLAAYTSRNQFLPAVEVIATMAPCQRDKLANNVRRIITNVNALDIAVFGAMIAGDVSVRNRVIMTMVDYLRTEMSMAIVDR